MSSRPFYLFIVSISLSIILLHPTHAKAGTLLIDNLLCQLSNEATRGIRLFELSSPCKYAIETIENFFSREEAELLLPLVYKFQETDSMDTLIHFLEYIERFPVADNGAITAKSWLDRLDPTMMVKNMILPKNRYDAIVLFAHHLSETPHIFDEAGHSFGSSLLEAFYKKRLAFNEQLATAQRPLQGAVDTADAARRASIEADLLKKRKISNACLSSRHTPEIAQAGKRLAKYSTGIIIGSTLYSYHQANKDKPKDLEFYARVGTDLALQLMLSIYYGEKTKSVYGSALSNWSKSWTVLRDITLKKNGITAAIYSTLFGVTLSQAEDEIARLKLEDPQGWEKINVEFQQSLQKIVEDNQLQEKMEAQTLAFESAEAPYQQLELKARQRGIISSQESIEEAINDPVKEEALVELLFELDYEASVFSSIELDDQILWDATKRFSFDSAFALATTAVPEKMLAFMALSTILCHAPVNTLAFPAAFGFYVTERYLTDQLYYSGRAHLLGY